MPVRKDSRRHARRNILHVDMDAFYASVEQRDNPELRGKPVVVGGSGNRGVVAAASYESRVFGVRSAMPMREARRLCPELIQTPVRMSHYQSVSAQIFGIFRSFTPMVEGLSLDEAFLDITDSLALFGSDVDIARGIKTRIREETSLNASVGVAANKLVAKIASDLDKPNGLCVITDSDKTERLDPLKVEVIPGIGKVTLAKLHAVGVRTIRDLRTSEDALLERVFGRFAGRMRERASGIDDRPVETDREEKSVSAEETFDVDLVDRTRMHGKLLELAERTTTRLRKKGLAAGTVQVKIRRADFSTSTRQRSLHPPSNGTDTLYAAARGLLDEWRQENPGVAVRLLGFGGSELQPDRQADLFSDVDDSRKTEMDQAVDNIRDKFGSAAVGRARTLDDD